MPKKLPQFVPNIFVHFLQLFRTFPLFFTTFHQNHPKTTSLFNCFLSFFITFYHFLAHFFTLIQRTCARFLLFIQHLSQASLLQKTAPEGNISV